MAEPYMATIYLWTGPTFVPDGYVACNNTTYQVQQYQAVFSLIGNTFGGNGTTTFNIPDLRGRTPIGLGPIAGAGLPFTMGQTIGAVITTGQVTTTGSITLTAANVPGHTHPAAFVPATGTQSVPISQAGSQQVNIPVGATVPSTATPSNLSGAQYLSNGQSGTTPFKGGFVSSQPASQVALATGPGGVQITGTPGLTANPTINVVTGGSVIVQPNTPMPPTPVALNVGGTAQINNNFQPSMALNYIFAMSGLYPPRP